MKETKIAKEKKDRELKTFIMFIVTCLIGTAIMWAFIGVILK